MRQLGEQWIENGRMYKVVLPGLCDGCDFNMGCLQNGGVNCKAGHCVTKQGHVKDLGPVNEDGLLPSSWGEYPEIIDFGDGSFVEVNCLLRKDLKILKAEYAYGDTRQEAIDNWNRMA